MDIIDNQPVLGYVIDNTQIFDSYKELADLLGYPDAAVDYRGSFKMYSFSNLLYNKKPIVIMLKVYHSINSKNLIYLVKDYNSNEKYIVTRKAFKLIHPSQIYNVKFIDVWNMKGENK